MTARLVLAAGPAAGEAREALPRAVINEPLGDAEHCTLKRKCKGELADARSLIVRRWRLTIVDCPPRERKRLSADQPAEDASTDAKWQEQQLRDHRILASRLIACTVAREPIA
jgi:hypothetical protein